MIESCASCGFDATQMPALAVGADLADRVDRLVDSVRSTPEGLLTVRPEPDCWSAVEYVFHLSQALATTRDLIERGLATERPHLEPPDPDVGLGELAAFSMVPADVLGRLERRVARLLPQIELLVDGAEHRSIVMGHSRIRGNIGEITLTRVARNGLHEVVHHAGDIASVIVRVHGQGQIVRSEK